MSRRSRRSGVVVAGDARERGLLEKLFDFSFSSFVTPSIIKLLFALCILFSVVASLVIVFSGFSNSIPAGVACLFLSPLIFFLHVLFARVYLEVLIVLFRIAENTAELVRQNEEESPA